MPTTTAYFRLALEAARRHGHPATPVHAAHLTRLQSQLAAIGIHLSPGAAGMVLLASFGFLMIAALVVVISVLAKTQERKLRAGTSTQMADADF